MENLLSHFKSNENSTAQQPPSAGPGAGSGVWSIGANGFPVFTASASSGVTSGHVGQGGASAQYMPPSGGTLGVDPTGGTRITSAASSSAGVGGGARDRAPPTYIDRNVHFPNGETHPYVGFMRKWMGHNKRPLPVCASHPYHSTKSRFLEDLWGSFDGVHIESSMFMVEGLKNIGGAYLELFPIMDSVEQAEAMFPSIRTERGVVKYTSYRYGTHVLAEAGRRNPGSLNSRRHYEREATFRFATDAFEVNMDFLETAATRENYFRMTEQLNKNIHVTWAYQIACDIVDNAVLFYQEQLDESLPMNRVDFDARLTSRHNLTFALQKTGSGWEGVESAAWDSMSARNVVPTVCITTPGSLRFARIVRHGSRNYSERGNEIYPGNSAKNTDPYGAARTSLHNLRVFESRRFPMSDDFQDFHDPTVTQLTVSQRFTIGKPPDSVAFSTDYRTSMRTIQVVDGDKRCWQDISLQDALFHSGLGSRGGRDDDDREGEDMFGANFDDENKDVDENLLKLVLPGLARHNTRHNTQGYTLGMAWDKSGFGTLFNEFLRKKSGDHANGVNYIETDMFQDGGGDDERGFVGHKKDLWRWEPTLDYLKNLKSVFESVEVETGGSLLSSIIDVMLGGLRETDRRSNNDTKLSVEIVSFPFNFITEKLCGDKCKSEYDSDVASGFLLPNLSLRAIGNGQYKLTLSMPVSIDEVDHDTPEIVEYAKQICLYETGGFDNNYGYQETLMSLKRNVANLSEVIERESVYEFPGSNKQSLMYQRATVLLSSAYRQVKRTIPNDGDASVRSHASSVWAVVMCIASRQSSGSAPRSTNGNFVAIATDNGNILRISTELDSHGLRQLVQDDSGRFSVYGCTAQNVQLVNLITPSSSRRRIRDDRSEDSRGNTKRRRINKTVVGGLGLNAWGKGIYEKDLTQCESWTWLAANNIPLPVSFNLFRLNVNLDVGSVIFLRDGAPTGCVVVRNPAVTFTRNNATFTLTVGARFEAGTFIVNNQNLEIVPNTFSVKYNGGAGTTFHTLSSNDNEYEQDSNKSMHACAVPYSHEPSEFYTDITGNVHHRLLALDSSVTSNSGLQYPTAAFYSQKYNLAEPDHGVFDVAMATDRSMEGRTHTLAVQACHRVWNEQTKSCNKMVLGHDAFGSTASPMSYGMFQNGELEPNQATLMGPSKIHA